MSSAPAVPLSDRNSFSLVGGLWKGVHSPMQVAAVLRSTNFRGDGLLDYSDIAELEIETRRLVDRRLAPGDIIIERSGGGPKQPVGRVGYFVPPDNRVFCTSNFTTALRVIAPDRFDSQYVALYLHALYESGATETLQRATTGIRNLDWNEYLKFEVPALPLDEQRAIVQLASASRAAYCLEDAQILNLSEIKRVTMHNLFTRGLRGEPQRESEIGLVPESWEVVALGSLGRVGNGSTPKKTVPEYWAGGTYPWLTSAKVYDRQIVAAEQFVTEKALRECHLPRVEPGAILIAITGQGRTLGHCAVLGMQATINQHIAYVATDTLRAYPSFVRGYLETQYDYLRRVGSAGGSTKGALTCTFLRGMPIPLPKLDEQKEIARLLDTIDQCIDLHKLKREVFEELFKAILNKLVTGEIRVADLDLTGLGHMPLQEVAA